MDGGGGAPLHAPPDHIFIYICAQPRSNRLWCQAWCAMLVMGKVYRQNCIEGVSNLAQQHCLLWWPTCCKKGITGRSTQAIEKVARGRAVGGVHVANFFLRLEEFICNGAIQFCWLALSYTTKLRSVSCILLLSC